MIRTVLFAVVLSLGAAAVALPSAPAHAQEKKGLFSFFNRLGNDGSDGSDPVHMTPGTQGAAKGAETKTYGFGKNDHKSTALYENSPINDERARQAKNFDQWNSNELAKANASTQALIAQMKAEQEYNAKVALQQQAQLIAQTGQAMSAGQPPTGANAAVVQAMRNGAYAQILSSTQSAAGMTLPAAAVPSASPPPAAVAEEPQSKARPQGLFNRIIE